MKFNFYIFIIGLFIWIFPAIRQHSTRLFYYFYLLAIAEPLGLLAYTTFGIYPTYVFIAISILQIITFQKIDTIKLPKLVIIGIVLLAVFLLYLFPQVSNYSTIFLEFVITLQLIRLFSIDFFQKETFNIFMMVIVLYEITIFLNMILLLMSEVANRLKLHETTGLFQFFLALVFTVFTEESALMKVKLKSVEEKLLDQFNSPSV